MSLMTDLRTGTGDDVAQIRRRRRARAAELCTLESISMPLPGLAHRGLAAELLVVDLPAEIDYADADYVDNEYAEIDTDDDHDSDDVADDDVGRIVGASVGAVLLLAGLPDDPDPAWKDRALCAETDPEAFFPEKGGSTREAKRVCASCDVRGDCLDFALSNDERFGIWGGLSERERRRLKKQVG